MNLAEHIASRGKWEARFWAKGYGRVHVRPVMIAAHRLSWMLAHGASAGEACVLHRCDNPSCVNPTHLLAGVVPA